MSSEEQMNMVEILSEELGEKELKIMKLEEENKKLKENLMKCEVNWLYYWSDEEMGEDFIWPHPEWWNEELDNFTKNEPDLEEDFIIDWKQYYPELYPKCKVCKLYTKGRTFNIHDPPNLCKCK